MAQDVLSVYENYYSKAVLHCNCLKQQIKDQTEYFRGIADELGEHGPELQLPGGSMSTQIEYINERIEVLERIQPSPQHLISLPSSPLLSLLQHSPPLFCSCLLSHSPLPLPSPLPSPTPLSTPLPLPALTPSPTLLFLSSHFLSLPFPSPPVPSPPLTSPHPPQLPSFVSSFLVSILFLSKHVKDLLLG